MTEGVSAVLGFVLGGIVMLLWTMLGRWLGDDRFWPAFQRIARDLATGAAPERFFRQYAELLKLLAAYLAKTTCRVGVAILPVLLTCSFLAPVVSRWAMRTAGYLDVYPAQSLSVRSGSQSLRIDPHGRVELPPADLDLPVRVVTRAAVIELPRLTAPVAASSSAWACLALQLLGVDAIHAKDGPPLLMLRPSLADRNPAYPFLSDLEFSFWTGLCCSSLVIGLLIKLKR